MIPGNYILSAESTDINFDAVIDGDKVADGKFTLRISSKNDSTIAGLHQLLQGNEYEFPIKVSGSDKRFTIVNPIINVHIADKVPSKLILANGVEEIQCEGVNWYDSFLWSNSAQEKTVIWDLEPIFKNELHYSNLSLRFNIAEGESVDFQASFNGQSITDDQIITLRPNEPALLEVRFNHDAKTGKRYFSLSPSVIDGLDFINDYPSDQFSGISLRTKYNVGWNPLKTFLFWLGIILLAVLLFWLIILKRIIFPQIKISRITITGPGSYYSSKKIKGARKIILTKKRKSQNFISRIFTGKIKYIKADHFSPELSIVAAGGKKKVRLRYEVKSHNSWEIYPSLIFGQYDRGYIINKSTNDKSEIEFN